MILFILDVKVQAMIDTTLHRQAEEAYRPLISVAYSQQLMDNKFTKLNTRAHIVSQR